MRKEAIDKRIETHPCNKCRFYVSNPVGEACARKEHAEISFEATEMMRRLYISNLKDCFNPSQKQTVKRKEAEVMTVTEISINEDDLTLISGVLGNYCAYLKKDPALQEEYERAAQTRRKIKTLLKIAKES